jgi:hypothetical protein
VRQLGLAGRVAAAGVAKNATHPGGTGLWAADREACSVTALTRIPDYPSHARRQPTSNRGRYSRFCAGSAQGQPTQLALWWMARRRTAAYHGCGGAQGTTERRGPCRRSTQHPRTPGKSAVLRFAEWTARASVAHHAVQPTRARPWAQAHRAKLPPSVGPASKSPRRLNYLSSTPPDTLESGQRRSKIPLRK